MQMDLFNLHTCHLLKYKLQGVDYHTVIMMHVLKSRKFRKFQKYLVGV